MDEGMRRLRIDSQYKFANRSKGKENLLYLLAGFRDFLWPMVFDRLTRYVPDNTDVCIVSAGIYSEELDRICEEHDWSYLHNEERDLGRVQNLAIYLHPNAKMIYKMDEDMFLTKGSFEAIRKAYDDAARRWEVGFAAPLIPINWYGYVRVLDLSGKADEFEKEFGHVRYIWSGTGNIVYDSEPLNAPIWADVEAAKFMWREIDLDQMNEDLSKEPLKWGICPLRFNIGFILFSRELWEDMDYFWVYPAGNIGMGEDEVYLTDYLNSHARVIVVSENTLVGHFGSGAKQTEGVKEYLEEHPEKFLLDEKY